MMRNTNLQIEISTLTMLRYAALAGFGFALGILGAAEVLWILWALVQAAKGLLLIRDTGQSANAPRTHASR